MKDPNAITEDLELLRTINNLLRVLRQHNIEHYSMDEAEEILDEYEFYE